MSKTFVEQVGGSHYASKGDAHWDIMERYDIAYLEATASKYTVRFDRKGKPREDLLKGKSYLLKLLAERDEVRRRVPQAVLKELSIDIKQSPAQTRLLMLIHRDGYKVALIEAIGIIDLLLRDYPE